MFQINGKICLVDQRSKLLPTTKESKESLFSKSRFKSKKLTSTIEAPVTEEPAEDISLRQGQTKQSWWAKSKNPEAKASLGIKKLNQERMEKTVSMEKKKRGIRKNLEKN